MFFYLDYSRTPQSGTVKPARISADTEAGGQPNTLYIREGRQRLVSVTMPGGSELLLLGDPVYAPQADLGPTVCPNGTLNITQLYETVRGHYYWFFLEQESLRCGSAFGAVFPIYFAEQNGRVFLSSSSFFLAKKIKARNRNRRNLLERLLFNYPIFNSTWWEGIQLLGAHHVLRLQGENCTVEPGFNIENIFGEGENHSRNSLHELAELFEAETALFLPDAPYGISFTGGFDGRTLLAAARKAGHSHFLTYSFGHPEDADLTFPQEQTRRLGIPYRPILLDDDYVQKSALPSAWKFMELTEYNGNFGRPHYHFAAQNLAKEVDYLITGNFGSEFFRAMHQPGVMMTEQLIRIFSSPDDSWKDSLRQPFSEGAGAFFRNEWDALIAEIEAYLEPMQGWDPNHRFYHFVFQEIFRKYFGPELIMQRHYLNNRTPFLSLRFFRALNSTIWSGVHARLFEKMKNKRMKGQQFYAAFIRRADPQLYRMQTSKGYSAADVLEPWRMPLLLAGVAWQKFGKKPEVDTNAVEAFFRQHQHALLRQIEPESDTDLLESGLHSLLAQPGKALEERIKYTSIAAGWAAARQHTEHTQLLAQ
ncbi:MAG: hypothetical protein H6569_12810 [Lewinellaceae bacterium]|nr:hypothetical protein [Lewinellaceae bacterium]